MNYSEFVKKERLKNKWSQEELANRATVSKMTLVNFELGGNIRMDKLDEIMCALGYELFPVEVPEWKVL